ncbi:MAG TPA: ACT domain-containing protein [Alphaproteobacteria bacterium]|nr:ACT domain-containing protein [Alphaproteobacteria bacterium]
MAGETDLSALLRGMRPLLADGVFVFATLPPEAGLPPALRPLMLFHEAEGPTLVIRREAAQAAGLAHTYPCRMITLTIHSSLSAVGFLAAITRRLAEAGISVNPVSAYHHDHLFVPVERAEDTMMILGAMGAG